MTFTQCLSRMVAVVAVCGIASVASAQSVPAAPSFSFLLSGSQEVPPGSTNASGEATITIIDGATPTPRLEYTITIDGLDHSSVNLTPGDTTDDIAGIHFHNAPAGSNGPVVFGILGPDNDLDNSSNPTPSVTGGKLTWTGDWDATEGNGTTLVAQFDDFLNNNLYINVHTPDEPAGEIRGQVVIPTPAAAAMLMPVLGLTGWRCRRRRA